MNIFVCEELARDCAIALDNKRVVKMVLETAQMLCTVINEEDWVEDKTKLYAPTHSKHPCTVWAKNPDNWLWLHDYFNELCREYHYRTGNTHLCEKKLSDLFDTVALKLRMHGHSPFNRTPFANCTQGEGYNFKHLAVLQAYREALKHKWLHDKREPKWSKRQKPLWAS